MQVATRDRQQPVRLDHLPITVVLDRLRSAFNVGNIFRLAEALRVEQIITCGYTATPPHAKLEKTARGCDRIVHCQAAPTARQSLVELRRQGYRLYGVETVDGATSLWQTQFDFPAAVVFGNEALGVADATLDECDVFVRLPAFGVKNSINVGNCAAVVLYEMARQYGLTETARP